MKIQKLLVILIAVLFITSCENTNSIKYKNDIAETVTDEMQLPLEGRLIVIDPGHGLNVNSDKEPISPLSDKKKPANVSGTRGKNQTEEQLNLAVSYKLYRKLCELGADIVMTRYTEKTYLTNIERAELANDLNADICIKIHADGNEDKALNGMSMLVPTGELLTEPNIVKESQKIGEIVLSKVIDKTGAKNNGITKRSDLTGFNWSKVPVILLEMGYMTNDEENDKLLSEEYRENIVVGICDGILEYFNTEY